MAPWRRPRRRCSACLLLLGLANFLLLHQGAAAAALARVRRFVEAEMAIGLAVLAVAASLTSVPPAADLPEDRVTWAEIAERFTPAGPRLSSPDHADLAIPALQARLDAEWRARSGAVAAPQAFTPGEGLLPPRNAGDIAWSEYNHHWSGILVLLVGLAALLDGTGKVPLARHWPLLFLLLALFILVRSDPEAWPLGEIGLLESLRDPEVVQHKLAAAAGRGLRAGRMGGAAGAAPGPGALRLPLAMLPAACCCWRTPTPSRNVKEALLVELVAPAARGAGGGRRRRPLDRVARPAGARAARRGALARLPGADRPAAAALP